jgi:hypothetical protein
VSQYPVAQRMPLVFCFLQAKHRDSLRRQISGLEAAIVPLFSQLSASVAELKQSPLETLLECRLFILAEMAPHSKFPAGLELGSAI